MEASHEAKIVPIHNGVERYNGIRMAMGRMSVEQLGQLETYARERIADAQADLLIVQHYMEQVAPGPDAA